MKKNNPLPIKWVLIIIVLMGIVYRTHQVSKYMETHHPSHVSSTNTFFEFLADFFGLGDPIPLFGENPKQIGAQNQNRPNAGQSGYAHGNDEQNPNSMMAAGSTSALQGSDTAQQGNNKNNTGINAANNAEISTENNPANNSEIETANGPESNAEFNAENNAEINAENNAENPLGNNPDNAEINAENNASNNADTNAENNPVIPAGNNPGNNSGGNPGDNSGNNPGGSDNGPGDNSGYTPPSNLPTINPIPSDNVVAQNVSQQNKNNDSLSVLVASRQALVVPVQEQAQASKYQAVDSQSIPAVSTNQAPADIVAKVQSRQLSLH